MQNEVSSRTTVIAFIIVIIMIVGGAALLLASRPQPVQITINPPLPTATPLPTNTPSPIQVYVTGAVAQPETIVLVPAGSRVQAVLEAAGGVTEDADLQRVNLAGIVRDGDQIHVPSLLELTAEAPSAEIVLPTPSGGEVIYINTATLEELMTLPGIGEKTAQDILDYREANGNFASLDDLDAVPGIGPATLEELAALISFE